MEEQRLLKKKKQSLTKGNKMQFAAVCNDLAEHYMRVGSLEKSRSEYENAAKIYKELDKPILFARANRMIGEICISLAEFDAALKHEQIHLDIAKEHNNELEKQRALASIGHTYLTKAIIDPDNIDSDLLNLAHSSFLDSLTICRRLKNINSSELSDMKARLYLNLGVVKEHRGDFVGAEDFMKQSIEICKIGDIFDQLHYGYYTLGRLHTKNKNYKDAITNFNYALDVGDRLSDKKPAVCSTYVAKAEVLIKLSEFSSAKHVLILAFKLKSPNLAERNSIEQNLKVVAAICQAEDSLIITPLTEYKKRKELYERMGDGAAFLKSFDNAIHYYEKMLECAIACGESGKDLLPVYVSLAQTYKDNEQYKMAYEYFQKEYEISKNNPKECYKTLLEIADILKLIKTPHQVVVDVYIKARKEAQATKKVKAEGKVISHFISFLKISKMPYEELEEELNHLGYESSDGESEGEAEGGTPNIGNDINLSEILSNTDELNDESGQLNQKRKRGRNRNINKNLVGESALHEACIKGNISVVLNLVEQNHPVNIRDHCGWLPIHEACNHGYTDIVKFLISKGASVNDRGGIKCEGVTPLHDACSNGHLEVIELLLDNGASPIVLTDAGNTPLDFLQDWKVRNSLEPRMQLFYDSITNRMKAAFEQAGRSVNQSNEIDACFQKPKSFNRSPRGSPKLTPTKSRSLTPQKSPIGSLRYRVDVEDDLNQSSRRLRSLTPQKSPIGSLRYRVDVEDLNQPSCSKFTRNKSTGESETRINSIKRNLSLSSASVSNNDNSGSPACSEYKRVMDGLRNRVSEVTPKRPRKSTSAFVSDDDIDNDTWLDDDLGMNQPKKRKRHSSGYSNKSITCHSSDTEQENDEININSGYDSSDSVISVPSSKHKKSQTSLLDSGFVRNQNESSLHTLNSRAVTLVDKLTNKPYKRQQKLNSFVKKSQSSEIDNAIQQITIDDDSLPNTARPSVRLLLAVNVRIENKLWRIPIPADEINVLTIEWLATEAAKRYYKQEGISPTLQLLTRDGAILINEDPLRMIFISDTQAEEVQSCIVSWNLPPLPERYVEACHSLKIEPCHTLKKCLDECQGTLNLKLVNTPINKIQFPPLFRAINRQNNLQHLDLTEINLLNDGMQQLCSVFSSLVQLGSLNLSGNNISGEGMRFFSEIFSKTETNILGNLNDLNLSFNLFGADTLQYLAIITQKLKLRVLNLCGCSLPANIFTNVDSHGVVLNFKYLEHLDLSFNDLNSDDIMKFISYLNFNIVSNLNVSQNTNVAESGITKTLAEKLSQCEKCNLKTLNLAKCHVNDTEIWELLRILAKYQEVNSLNLSFNSDLSAVSLRRVIQHRPSFSSLIMLGCSNIVQYFDQFTFASNTTNEVYKNKLTSIQVSINYIKNSKEAVILEDMWMKEWNSKAKVKKILGKILHLSVVE